MKIIFMGTPEFSVNVLKGLIDNYEVSLVVTQPDKEIGRKKELKPTPVKQLAQDYGIKVFQPKNIKEDYKEIVDINPDIIITCAYGQFIPKEILELPKYGSINVHASLLPKLRGGSPIHHALIDGFDKTGITIMQMVEKMDAGDIISTVETDIQDCDNLESLHDRLSILGRDLLLETLPNYINGNVNLIKQNENDATFAYNIKREEEYVEFNNTSRNIFNKIRGLSPIPGTFTYLDNKIFKIYNSKIGNNTFENKQIGEICKIYNDGIGVKTKDGEIILTEIQIEGKKKVNVKDYLLGKKEDDLLGKVFGK